MKSTHGGVLLLLILLHGCFSRFLYCANGTKSGNASQLLICIGITPQSLPLQFIQFMQNFYYFVPIDFTFLSFVWVRSVKKKGMNKNYIDIMKNSYFSWRIFGQVLFPILSHRFRTPSAAQKTKFSIKDFFSKCHMYWRNP